MTTKPNTTRRRMRTVEADELTQRFNQLMRDLGASKASPVEWRIEAGSRIVYVSLWIGWKDAPLVKIRRENRTRTTVVLGIGKCADEFTKVATAVCEALSEVRTIRG